MIFPATEDPMFCEFKSKISESNQEVIESFMKGDWQNMMNFCYYVPPEMMPAKSKKSKKDKKKDEMERLEKKQMENDEQCSPG